MATISELVVLVNANTTQLQSGLAKAEASTSKFATVAKVGLGIAAVAAVKFVADSVQAYQEHQTAVLELQNVISHSPKLVGASTAAFEQQATELQNLTGVQDEEILKADAILGRFGLTADQLNAVNPLVLDYARATGQDAATAATTLGKGLLGNTRALKTLGIQFTATGHSGQDFHAIMDLVESKVGGLAEAYGKTLPGQLAITAAKFDDIKETVGKAVVPILGKLLDMVKPLIGVLQLAADHLDIVVTAGVGFAAWKFIPPLLDSIAAGFAKIGFTGVGVGILETSAALTAAVPPAVAFAAAYGGLTAVVAGHDILGLVDDANKLRESMEINTKAFGQSHIFLGRVAVSSNLVGESFKDTAAATQKTAAEQADLSQKLQQVTEDMHAQRQAAQQLAGGILGLTADALDLADKQNIVNKMQDQGHDSGKKYNEAVLDLLNSQAQFKEDAAGFVEKLKESGLSLDDAKDKVINLGKNVGLTRGDVLNAIGSLDKYKAALDGIPANVTTDVVTRFSRVGVGDFQGHLPGTASGGIVTSPQIRLVGEAGPEAIIPLSKAGGMGDVNIVVNGWVGSDAALARHIREELLKLKGSRVSLGLG